VWNPFIFPLTVFARSNTAIVGSNPTEAWMFVCVLCAFFCIYIVSSETASRPNKRLMRTYHWISLFMSYKVSKLAHRIWVILIANERVKKNISSRREIPSNQVYSRNDSIMYIAYIFHVNWMSSPLYYTLGILYVIYYYKFALSIC
jgi:hypothetical protein